MTSHLSEIDTVPALLAVVGESTCNRWIALGQADSDIHEAYGREADALINEGARPGVVYRAIARMANRGFETIRKSHYVYVKFTDAEREKYHLVPYSIKLIAIMREDKYEVLDHYLQNRASVDEVKTLFPSVEDADFEQYFNSTKLPRNLFYGIIREIYGLPDQVKNKVTIYLNKIMEIIAEANK